MSTGKTNSTHDLSRKIVKNRYYRWKIVLSALNGEEIKAKQKYLVNDSFKRFLEIKENIIDKKGNFVVKVVRKGADSYKKEANRNYKYNQEHPDSDE